jgi:capsule polysaccharide modification protein KpsS
MVTFGQVFFPRYRHHRDVQTGRQALLWGRSFLRKAIYHFREQSTFEEIKGPLWGKYFLIGLQVYNDSQVKLSRFTDVRDFIDEVLVSFSSAAPSDAYLVFKHHPADRAYRDYAEFILERASALKIGDRVRYVHDLHLPTLLEGARGTVVINSTIGWSSLHHKTPVYALDEATYGYVGLAAAGKLDDFWGDPPAVAPHLTRAMQHHLRATTQANGSVWVRLPGARATGFRWPPAFEKRLVELTVQAKMRSPKSPASSE